MLIQILHRTPPWVWALLGGLIALGAIQTRDRVMGLKRLMLIPLTMTAFSIYGTVSAFGGSMTTWMPWLLCCTAVTGLMLRLTNTRPIHYDRENARFTVPGSWLPMAVILSIFCTKYATGVLLALRPSLAQDLSFAMSLSLLYGAFSGFFIGRTIAIARKARAL